MCNFCFDKLNWLRVSNRCATIATRLPTKSIGWAPTLVFVDTELPSINVTLKKPASGLLFHAIVTVTMDCYSVCACVDVARVLLIDSIYQSQIMNGIMVIQAKHERLIQLINSIPVNDWMAQIKQTKTRIEYINPKTTTSTAAKIINFCIFSMCYVLVHILCTRSKLDVSIFEPSLGNIEKKQRENSFPFPSNSISA